MGRREKMETPKTRVRVNIYGEEFSLRSDGNEDYIREVAGYLDRTMRDVAEKTANKSPSKIAVLAALNIVDELLSERKKGEHGDSDLENRANQIISLMDANIPD